MGLFGFGKKKDEKKENCSCSCGCTDSVSVETKNADDGVKKSEIKILGSGCAKCNELEANTVEALKELGQNTEIEHVTDFIEIAQYGVMQTPAIVVGNKVLSYGKVLSKEQIVDLLKNL